MLQIIILLQQIESCENSLNNIEMCLRSIIFRVEYTMLLEKYPKQKPAKWIPLTHLYMAAHFPGLVQALQ